MTLRNPRPLLSSAFLLQSSTASFFSPNTNLSLSITLLLLSFSLFLSPSFSFLHRFICFFLSSLRPGESTEASWGDFYRDCGQKSQLGNPLQAVANFRDKFAGKTVRWTGLVKHVKEGLFSSNFLFLVMYPTMTLAGQQHKKAGGRRDGFSSSSSSPFSFGRTGGGGEIKKEEKERMVMRRPKVNKREKKKSKKMRKHVS